MLKAGGSREFPAVTTIAGFEVCLSILGEKETDYKNSNHTFVATVSRSAHPVIRKPVQGPAGPASGAVLAVPSSAPPTVASPFSLPVSLPPRVPSAPLQPVAVAPVPVAAPVTGVPPKTTIIASHTGSLIQVCSFLLIKMFIQYHFSLCVSYITHKYVSHS